MGVPRGREFCTCEGLWRARCDCHYLEGRSGESDTYTEYWLSSLKVVTIVAFIVIGILVNVGVNRERHYVGARYWHIPGAPFVGGFGGFAKVFVTASFACELTRSPCATVIPAELIRVRMTSFRFRRWYRVSGNHGRRNEEPDEKYAAGGQICFLAVWHYLPMT